MARVLIGLGSNLGERLDNLHAAFGEIERHCNGTGTPFVSSPVYETAPISDLPQPQFLNAVLVGETQLAPGQLLARLMDIERCLGRDRSRERVTGRNAPRLIDCDLLDYEGLEIDLPPTLVLPHPEMHYRWFVMRPLADIVPDWRHPVLGATTDELLENLPAGGTPHAPPLG